MSRDRTGDFAISNSLPVFLAIAFATIVLPAQETDRQTADEPVAGLIFLLNDFEDADNNQQFSGWENTRGEILTRDLDEFHSGKASGKLDCREPSLAFRQMSPELVRGKRIRYSAFVKTANVDMSDSVRLGMRVVKTNEKGREVMLAFDNMVDRPIRTERWRRYEIVLEVDEEADKIEFGLFVIGNAVVWIDDVQIQSVSQQVATTEMAGLSSANDAGSRFFSNWLWFVALGLMLSSLAHIESSTVQRFCLWFSIVYWLLYLVPQLIVTQAATSALTWFGVSPDDISNWEITAYDRFNATANSVVQWTASNLFGMEEPLNTMSTGSGDATFHYIYVFDCFAIALLVAFVLSCIPNIRQDRPWVRDVFRSFLRYALAIQLLGYGLAKAGFITTQFAESGWPSESQLNRTFGESSPMGLLWTFMAASPMYTFFAGLVEVVPAILLLFRRTTTIGASIAFAVMTNVFILNLCYDVPVKLYSFHLVIAAFIILLPELPRVFNALLGNKIEASPLLSAPWTESQSSTMVKRTIKCFFILFAFVVPIAHHISNETGHEHEVRIDSGHLLLNREFRWISEVPFNR